MSDIYLERTYNFLKQVGYSERYKLTYEAFKEATGLGCLSKTYTHVVSWLSCEIREIGHQESYVNPTKDCTEIAAFLVELSTFLKELECSHLENGFFDFAKSDDFKQKEWAAILEYLTAELATYKLYREADKENAEDVTVKLPESEIGRLLRESVQALGFSKPPANITTVQLFSKLDAKVRELQDKFPQLVKEPIFTGTLSEKQWAELQKQNEDMRIDYGTRREVLLKRLNLTMESFKWGDKLPEKKKIELDTLYQEIMALLTPEPSVNVSDILSAREDILLEEKTCSSSVRARTQTTLNKIIIGAVPDRGGRLEEQQPPPPEVPSWKASSTHGSFSGSSYGGNRVSPASSYGGRQVGNGTSGSSQGPSSGPPTEYSGYGGGRYGSSGGYGSSGRSGGRGGNGGSGRSVGGSSQQQGDNSDQPRYGEGSPRSGNAPLEQYAPERPVYHGDQRYMYTDPQEPVLNPPVLNCGRGEGSDIVIYSPPAFRSLFQPQPQLVGFGGYGRGANVGAGGYSATGGNYEQNAPFVQPFQPLRGQNRGRQPRGSRSSRRSGRPRGNNY